MLSVLEGGYSLSSTPPKAKSKAPISKPERKLRGTTNSPLRESKSAAAQESKEAPLEKVGATVPDQNRFGILEGDGGLVKGVLAHVTALCNWDGWTSS